MFKKAKNIDTAFRQIRLNSLVAIAALMVVTVYTVYRSFQVEANRKEQVLVLPTGKVIEALATERQENLPVEIHDHVCTFHSCFFGLEPDEKQVEESINKALYLADKSAKSEYDNLKEKNYFSNIISANISQKIHIDSVSINADHYPFYFRCYARLEIIRTSTVAYRSLITEGWIRNVQRSPNNSHGFLIERWRTLENKDLGTKQRQ